LRHELPKISHQRTLDQEPDPSLTSARITAFNPTSDQIAALPDPPR
jgi:hypothetical protein